MINVFKNLAVTQRNKYHLVKNSNKPYGWISSGDN